MDKREFKNGDCVECLVPRGIFHKRGEEYGPQERYGIVDYTYGENILVSVRLINKEYWSYSSTQLKKISHKEYKKAVALCQALKHLK